MVSLTKLSVPFIRASGCGLGVTYIRRGRIPRPGVRGAGLLQCSILINEHVRGWQVDNPIQSPTSEPNWIDGPGPLAGLINSLYWVPSIRFLLRISAGFAAAVNGAAVTVTRLPWHLMTWLKYNTEEYQWP